MSQLSEMTTADVLASVLVGQPEVLANLNHAWSQAWAATDPYILELCRLRISMLLGCSSEFGARTPEAQEAGLTEATIRQLSRWTDDHTLRPVDRACLSLTEQYVIDVANLDDATVGAVSAHLGDAGLQNFISALLVVEQRQRLRLAWEQLFSDRGKEALNA